MNDIKAEILRLLEAEIEFAKKTGMPQFTLGLMQAKKVVENYETWGR